jgi:hypothetical protein
MVAVTPRRVLMETVAALGANDEAVGPGNARGSLAAALAGAGQVRGDHGNTAL